MARIPASERDAFYESRRTHLAEVALKLWAKGGFDQTSVAAIAREAGVAKGTFYLYFDSKNALLADVLRRNSLVPNVQQLVEDLQHRSLEEAVYGFVRGSWRHLCDHRELVLIVLRELPTHLDQAQMLIERVMVPANQVLADYLEAHIPPERAEQLSLVISARGLLGMILAVFITQEVLGGSRFLPVPEDEVTTTLAELFLNGVTRPTSVEETACSDTSGSID
jgi:AcrR family transcriptional regulator